MDIPALASLLRGKDEFNPFWIDLAGPSASAPEENIDDYLGRSEDRI